MKDEQHKKRRKKRINPFLVILAFIFLLIGAFVFSRSSFFHVEQFDVEGNAYYTDDEILLMGGCETGKNIFWDIDSKKIRSRLLQDAYMEDVKVRRLLPHTVKITVTERAQTAAIAYGDKYVVIDAAGIVLRKAGVDPKVTVLKGLTISKLSMGEPIEIEEKVLFRQCLEMISVMRQNDMYFKTIVISKTEARAYILDSLYCEGTPEMMIKAMQDGKLQAVTEELFDREIERGKIQISGENYISFTPKIE